MLITFFYFCASPVIEQTKNGANKDGDNLMRFFRFYKVSRFCFHIRDTTGIIDCISIRGRIFIACVEGFGLKTVSPQNRSVFQYLSGARMLQLEVSSSKNASHHQNNILHFIKMTDSLGRNAFLSCTSYST